MSSETHPDEDEALWFYVQSKSDASRLIRRYVAQKLGPLSNEDGTPCRWQEWRKDSPTDRALYEEATEVTRGDRQIKRRPDQQSGETVTDAVYRELLVERVVFFWLRKRSLFPFAHHRDSREGSCQPSIVNHTSGEVHLTQKAMLVRSLIDHYGERGYFDFHPSTFIFALKRGRSDPFQAPYIYRKIVPDLEAFRAGKSPHLWIFKPSTGSCGRGISILELKDAPDASDAQVEYQINAQIEKMVASYKQERSPEIIVQSYITKPLLYKGYKFDFRVYLMIASVKQPFIALYTHEGYLRVCSDEYNHNVSNRNAHITNFHVQRDHPLYDATTDSIEGRTTRVEYHQFIDYLLENNFLQEELTESESKRDALIRALDRKVCHCISQAVKSAVKPIGNHPHCAVGQFALLGVDLLLDAEGGVWLIEFTKSPAFRMQPEYLNELHSRVLCECVDIAMEVESRRDPETQHVDVQSVQAIQQSTAWSLLSLE